MTNTTNSSLVKYGDFSIEEAEEDKEELDRSQGPSNFLKLRVGKTTVRFIPPLPGKKWRRVTYMHYVDVPGAGRVSFVCPRLEAKKPCIVCVREQQLMNSGNEVDARKAKKLRAKRRCLAAVIDRAHEEDGPKVLGFGKSIEEDLIELRKDEDVGGNFVDPINGIDISITRVGTGENDTEYKVYPANKGQPLPLSQDPTKMNDWIANQPNLERWVKVESSENIELMLKGEKPKRSRDGDEGNPGPSGRKPSRRASDDVIDGTED